MGIWSTDFLIIFKGILKGLAHCDQRWEGVFHTLHSDKSFKGLSYDGFFYVCMLRWQNRRLSIGTKILAAQFIELKSK